MPIDPDSLRKWPIADIEHTYSVRDTMLYALGLGCGADPMDESQLQYVYEGRLRALPSMAVVLGYPGFWISDPRTGADWKKVLHGEQGLEVFKPLPTAGTVIGRSRITGLFDKGKDKGAVMVSERDVIEKSTGDLLCRLTSTSMLRGDGGFDGPSGPLPRRTRCPTGHPTKPPASRPYHRPHSSTASSGDYNPLHADPAVARSGGFEKPILHGLCTFGVVCRALLDMACGNDPAKLRKMRVRFSAPVFPGETIVTELWKEAGGVVSFRAKVKQRDLVVINNGRAEVAA